MRNTISWACAACGEYTVADLKDRSPALLRCGHCFQPLQATPALEPKPRMRLSDEWLGDELIRPLFGRDERREGDRR